MLRGPGKWGKDKGQETGAWVPQHNGGFINMVLDELNHLGKSPRPEEMLSISPRAVVPISNHLSQSPEPL